MRIHFPLLSALLISFLTPLASAQHSTPSGPIVLKGKTGMVIKGLHITSTSGDCVQLINSKDITIENSEIGPCAGNAVNISGGSGISVYDSYIHPETLTRECCDRHDGVLAVGTSSLTIQGNVIAYSESNIEVHTGSTVTVIGNLLLNPRGPETARGNNFQCWDNCSNVLVENNYALSSTDSKYKYPEATQDSINFGMTDHAVARNNYITGGHSSYGCGLIADYRADNTEFENNVLVNTGQCGIAIADGKNHVVSGNSISNRTPVAGSGNQALYVWQSYGADAECGLVTVSNNTAFEVKPDGTMTGYWKGAGCNPTTLSGNTFGKAAARIPLSVRETVAPAIPPQPKTCVVVSPYSTQTAWPACTQ
jgi:parallel beta-helix repeat protein